MKTLYRFVRIVTVGLVFFLLTSCVKDNHGYPEKVYFSSEGGSIVVDGKNHSYGHEIYGNEGSAYIPMNVDGESYDLIYKWLTLRVNPRGGVSFELIAEKNTTGSERRLTVYFMVENLGGHVDVIQK